MDRTKGQDCRRRGAFGLLTAAVVSVMFGVLLAFAVVARLDRNGSRAAQRSGLDVAIPARPLRTETGATTSLARYRGRIVVVTPFLTLCAELCPLTIGVLDQVDRRLRAAGLRPKVALLEVSVDPWRDSPLRLRAYRRMVGARWQLLTGTQSQLRAFWRPFHVWFKRTTADHRPPTDWLTGRPQTMDVEHTNGFFVLDARGHLRSLGLGMADVGGRLPARVRSLFGPEGQKNLMNPHEPWSAKTVLNAVARLLGRPIDAR